MINAGQFLISKKQYQGSDFLSVEMEKGYFLSYHKQLSVYIKRESDILLLGIAWQTDPSKSDPVSEIEKLVERYRDEIPQNEILSMEESWCGRYVLIVQGKVYLDACGLMGIFYSREGISSSCRVLAESMGLPEKIYEPSSQFYWMPSPLTHYEEIRRLLPSQIYHLYDGGMQGRQLTAAGALPCSSEQERIKRFADYFTQSLKNMEKTLPGQKILITVTGGYDSRTLLALAEYAKIDFECFTLGYEGISDGDVELPQKLCARLKRGHTYIPREREKYAEQRIEEYRRHTMGLINDQDKLLYAYGQYQELVEKYGKVVLLRGSVWEIITDYYGKYIGDEFKKEDVYNIYPAWDSELVRESLDAYEKWGKANPQKDLTDGDRFYWEQRCGSWLSAIEQSFDLFDDVTSLQPLNSRLLITMLAGFDREDRIIKNHQVKIIGRICPALNEIEYDGAGRDGIISFIKKEMARGIHRLKDLGLKRTVKLYIKIIKIKTEEKNAKKRMPRL